jgi:hypothetical protein
MFLRQILFYEYSFFQGATEDRQQVPAEFGEWLVRSEYLNDCLFLRLWSRSRPHLSRHSDLYPYIAALGVSQIG